MRSTWTDSRLDDFKNGVEAQLGDLNERVGEMDTRLTGRIDALQHTMVHVFVGIMVAMVTGFLGLAGLILTQM